MAVIFIEGLPASGKSSLSAALSAQVQPEVHVQDFYKPNEGNHAASDLLEEIVFFDHRPSLIERLTHLWSWTLLSVGTVQTDGSASTLVLERSPYTAFAAARPVLPEDYNEHLLLAALSKLPPHRVIYLTCDEDVRYHRLRERAEHHAGRHRVWHPSQEGEPYRRVFVETYSSLATYFPHVDIVDSGHSIAATVRAAKSIVECTG